MPAAHPNLKESKDMNAIPMKQTLARTTHWILAATVVLTMSACGGGGGSATPNPNPDPNPPDPTPTFNPADLQGRWGATVDSATPGGATAYLVNVVPGANNTAQAWLLTVENNHATRLTKVSVDTHQMVTGWAYDLTDDSGNAQALTNVTATSDLNASPKSLTVSGLASSPLVFTPSTAPADAANQADAASNWNASTRAGSVNVSWTVGSDGLLTGASSTGCSYTGNLAAQPTQPVFNIQFTESCPNLAARELTGIATVKSDLTALKVLATTANDAQGVALLFAK